MELSLLILIVVLALSLLQLAVGMVLGRYAPWGRSEEDSAESDNARQLHEFAQRLRDLVGSVAEDVEDHQAQILQANQKLTSLQTAERDEATQLVFDSVTRILQINRQLQSRLNHSEDKLQDQTQQLESHIEAARTDPLTGLPNRRAFDDEINRRMAHWRRKQVPLCLLMLDIDHFKRLNDRHGHAAGDQALRAMADVLIRTLREMDMVSRIGGEEFAAVLPDTDLSGAKLVAERLRSTISSERILFEQTELYLTVSVGVAAVGEGEDAASLLKRADEAMYAAKHAGRNRGYFHNGQDCQPIQLPGCLAAELSAFEVQTGNPPGPNDFKDPELTEICEDLRHHLEELTDG